LTKAFINNEVLRWALQRSGQTRATLAEKLATNEDRVEAWLVGDDLPSFKQAQRLASVLQVPFGILYLPEVPAEEIPVVEFRRLPNISKKISRDVLDLLIDIEFKRDWYRDYRLEEGFEPLDFVGKFDVEAPSSLVASDIRRELSRSSNSLFTTKKLPDRFLDELLKSAERIGIWVMRSGVVGNNTHRTIPVDQLRGFAIADRIVPLIFLNGRDSKAAQIFTFAHELAHIWIGKSSVDTGDLSRVVPEGDARVERQCNQIAADILVPSDEFARLWSASLSLDEQVSRISEAFSVSRVVVARRALEQGYVTEDDYREFYRKEAARWAALSEKAASGGSYYSTIPVRNGRTFTKAVAREAAVGRLLYREAGQLLGVQPSKVREIYERSIG